MDNTIYLILPTGKGKEGIKKEDIEVVQSVLKNMTDKSIFRSYGKGIEIMEEIEEDYRPDWWKPHIQHWGLIYWFPQGLEPDNLAILLDLKLLVKVDEFDKRYNLVKTKRIQ